MLAWIGKGLERLGRVISGIPLTDSGGGFFGGGIPTESGEDMTPELAKTLSAVFCAGELWGRAHVAMPCGVLAKGGSKKEYADTNPVHKIIHVQPNPEMTAAVWWKLVQNHRLFWGASFNEIEINGRGEPKYVWPIHPERVTVKRATDESRRLLYEIQGNNGATKVLERDEILIFPFHTTDGITFQSAITYGAEMMGGGVAAQKTGNRWFKNGGMPQLFFKHPATMQKDARDTFRREMRTGLQSRDNFGLLWEGMDIATPQIDPQAMQLLENKEFNVVDVCRFLDVPPNKVMSLLKSSYSTNEQADLDWVKWSVVPVAIMEEQEINNKLLKYPDFYCKFGFEGLLRGDSAARLAFLKGMREVGVYSVNDICDIEDMDRIGPEGDIRVVNATYIPLNKVDAYWEAKSQPGAAPGMPGDPNGDQPPADPPKSEDPPKPKKKLSVDGCQLSVEESHATESPKLLMDDPFFMAELGRIKRRENKAIEKAAKREMQLRKDKKPGEFLKWIDDFFPSHEALMWEILQKPTHAVGDIEHAWHYINECREIIGNHLHYLRSDLLAACEVPASDFEASIHKFIQSRSELSSLTTDN